MKDEGGETAAAIAERKEMTEIAVRLLERDAVGALLRNLDSDVRARLSGKAVDDAEKHGWTPLHLALVAGVDRNPGFKVAKLLLEHDAEVGAATQLVGWTPLHLAAYLSGFDSYPDAHEVVRELVERGADVNARTRIGGWTPLHVALASDKRYGREQGNASNAVQRALRAAGGIDESCHGAPMVPSYIEGGRYDRGIWGYHGRPGAPPATAPPGCEHDMLLSVPHEIFLSWEEVSGSFTAPNADEQLVFEGLGIPFGESGGFRLVALLDESGAVRPIFIFDHYTYYQGLCLDAQIGTHTAVFERRYAGTCCPEVHTAYFSYDAKAGTLVQAFLEDAAYKPDKPCVWRDRKMQRKAYQEALDALRVGKPQGLQENGEPGTLAARVVSADVVEAQLERLRALPDNVKVRTPEVASSRWQIVVAESLGSISPCDGVLLVWDGGKEQWRSIYDCAILSAIEVDGDRLSAALIGGTTHCGYRRQSCYLEVDLETLAARLWDEPHGDYWEAYHERPDELDRIPDYFRDILGLPRAPG